MFRLWVFLAVTTSSLSDLGCRSESPVAYRVERDDKGAGEMVAAARVGRVTISAEQVRAAVRETGMPGRKVLDALIDKAVLLNRALEIGIESEPAFRVAQKRFLVRTLLKREVERVHDEAEQVNGGDGAEIEKQTARLVSLSEAAMKRSPVERSLRTRELLAAVVIEGQTK